MPYLYIIFRRRALQFVALLRKETCNLGHPMGLRHSVSYYLYTRPLVYYLRERRETLERGRRELGSCAVCSLFYRALLQKRPIIWRSLLIVATPYLTERRETLERDRRELESCAVCSLFYRALLQKRPIIWRSLLIVATPYLTERRETLERGRRELGSCAGDLTQVRNESCPHIIESCQTGMIHLYT